MNVAYIIAGLIAIAASVGQIVLKIAVERQQRMFAAGLYAAILLEPLLWLGVLIYAFCSVAWLMVLSKSNVSQAYPILSLSFALVPLFAFFVLREPMNLMQWLAVGLIIAGVIILGATS